MTVAVPVATRIKTALKKLPIPGDDEQDRAEAERTAQMQAQRDAGIGTLQKYTRSAGPERYTDAMNAYRSQRKSDMISKLNAMRRNTQQADTQTLAKTRAQKKAAMIAKANMMRRNKKQQVAESTVSFKDFRKKIYEQIIINEQIEKSKE